MTLAEKVEQIVNNLYPEANFILASEFQADYESLKKDDSPYIVLNNMLEDNDEIKDNANFYTQTRIQISVFLKAEFDNPDSTSVSDKAPDSNTLVEEAKAISRKIYQNLYLSTEVNGQLSDGRVTHKPTIKELSSVRTGCISLARWSTSFVVKCGPIITENELTLTSDENGITEPFEGTELVPANYPYAINANANAGFRFNRWLIDGIEDNKNPTWVKMNKDISAFAEFVESLLKQLTISVISEGTTNPAPGVYQKESGIPFPITAIETNPELLFKKFTENGDDKFVNPLTVLMLDNTDVVAYFQAYIQDVFGTAPAAQKFIDQVGSNDVTYKNVQVANFVGSGDYVSGTIDLDETTNFRVCGYITQDMKDSNGAFFSVVGQTLYIQARGNQWGIRYGGLVVNLTPTGSIPEVTIGWHLIEIIDKILYIDNIFAYDMTAGVITPTLGIELVVGSINKVAFYTYMVNYMRVENQLFWNFQDGDDSTVIDSNGTGNDGEFIGGLLSDFRNTFVNGFDSILINNGHSRFQEIADDTKFIYAPYTDLGVPTKTSFIGYESPVEIPKNVISNNKILYDGVQVAGIETNATFEDIHDLEDDDNTIIEKTLVAPLYVSRLVKKG